MKHLILLLLGIGLSITVEASDEFYECNVQVSESGKSLTANPINLRTWIETTPGSKLVTPGTASTCSSLTAETRGVPVENLLIRERQNTFLDFCYVMGDSIGSYAGGIRLGIVRRTNADLSDPNFHKTNYIYIHPYHEGKGEFVFKIEEYFFKVSCE